MIEVSVQDRIDALLLCVADASLTLLTRHRAARDLANALLAAAQAGGAE